MIAYAFSMGLGDWFKRLFSAPARTDAPLDVANETDDEKTIDEERIEAGGGAASASADYSGLEAGEAAEGELSEYEPPAE